MHDKSEELQAEIKTDSKVPFGCSNEKLEVSTDGNVVSPVSDTQGNSSRNSEPYEALLENSKHFYQKLSEFHASTGLRQVGRATYGDTNLDLFVLYKEVMSRGGFKQVTEDGQWDEILSVFTSTSRVSNSLQLQELYRNLLYLFEQMNLFGTNGKPAVAPGPLPTNLIEKTSKCHPYGIGNPSLKRKRWDNLCQLSTALVDPGTLVGNSITGVIETKFESGYVITAMVGSRKLNGVLYHVKDHSGEQFAAVSSLMDGVGFKDFDSEPVSLHIQAMTEQNPLPQSSSKNKGAKKDPVAPRRVRSAYQIFLSKECDRLKKLHGRGSGLNIRKIATDTWKCLSENDRQPYIKESQMDKERCNSEMAAYKERQSKQISKMESRSCNPDASLNDYHVSLQTEGETNNNVMPDKSMIELAVQWMENTRQKDPSSQFCWDDFL